MDEECVPKNEPLRSAPSYHVDLVSGFDHLNVIASEVSGLISLL
jgi:hypothetical protein